MYQSVCNTTPGVGLDTRLEEGLYLRIGHSVAVNKKFTLGLH